MNHLFKRFAGLMLGVTLVFVLVSCGGAATPAPAPTKVPEVSKPTEVPKPTEPPHTAEVGQDTVVIAINSQPGSLTLDPLLGTDTTAAYAAWLLYETLMYDQVTKGLAENVDVSDDKTTYTFTLRPNAKFQDGTILTAQYVKSSWERAQQLDSPVWANVSNVEAIDDLTVRVTLTAPSLTFVIDQTPYLPIVKESANALQGNVVGTGSFKLTDGTGTGTITLEPNPFYGKPQAIPVQIELRTIADETLALQELKNANINLVFGANQSGLAFTELAGGAREYLQDYFDGRPESQPGPGGRRPRRPRPPKRELRPEQYPVMGTDQS